MINDGLLFIFSKTFSLGKQEHFNVKNGLNESHSNFTYLVPSDQAWEDIKKEHASVYKVSSHLILYSRLYLTFFQILFMGDFYYQTHHVLERHLKVGVKMSLKDMVNIQPSCQLFSY